MPPFWFAPSWSLLLSPLLRSQSIKKEVNGTRDSAVWWGRTYWRTDERVALYIKIYCNEATVNCEKCNYSRIFDRIQVKSRDVETSMNWGDIISGVRQKKRKARVRQQIKKCVQTGNFMFFVNWLHLEAGEELKHYFQHYLCKHLILLQQDVIASLELQNKYSRFILVICSNAEKVNCWLVYTGVSTQ